jgi:hypothetical protein
MHHNPFNTHVHENDIRAHASSLSGCGKISLNLSKAGWNHMALMTLDSFESFGGKLASGKVVVEDTR